eukprot:8293627-Pyramimonas_sp.AAC.1
MMGDKGCSESWAYPVAKFRERSCMAQGLDLGLAKSTSHFNMLCMSVLPYVGQLCAPTPEVLKEEERMLQ